MKEQIQLYTHNLMDMDVMLFDAQYQVQQRNKRVVPLGTAKTIEIVTLNK